MRRILSIVLALMVGLGPALANVPANALALGWSTHGDESVLPACCRRHGVHHCAAGMQASKTTSETSISTTGCCPCWPHALVSTVAPLAALGPESHALRFAIELRSTHQAEIAAGISDRRSWPKRGPPSFNNI